MARARRGESIGKAYVELTADMAQLKQDLDKSKQLDKVKRKTHLTPVTKGSRMPSSA